MTAFDNDRGVGGAVSFCRSLGKIAPIDYGVRYTRCGQLINRIYHNSDYLASDAKTEQ